MKKLEIASHARQARQSCQACLSRGAKTVRCSIKGNSQPLIATNRILIHPHDMSVTQ